MAVTPHQRNEMITRSRQGAPQPPYQEREHAQHPQGRDWTNRSGESYGSGHQPIIGVPEHKWGYVPWHRTPQGQQLVVLEHDTLKPEFPGFVGGIDNEGRLYFVGTIDPPNSPDASTYTVAAICAHGHAEGANPAIVVLEPELRSGAPHRFNDGSLCVIHGDAPPGTSLRDFLQWTVQWLTRYEKWLRTGERW